MVAGTTEEGNDVSKTSPGPKEAKLREMRERRAASPVKAPEVKPAARKPIRKGGGRGR